VNPTKTPEDIDAIRERLKARDRRGHEFDIAEILNDKEPAKVRVRRPTKAEQDFALAAAHDYVAKKVARTPSAAQDDDLLRDAKSACIVATCFRRADKDLPLWPTGEVLMEELEADAIGALVAVVNLVRERDFAGFVPLDEAAREAIIRRCVDGASAAFPEEPLAIYSHGFLARLVVDLALLIETMRQEKALGTETEPEPS
jgi:hypothetical protein